MRAAEIRHDQNRFLESADLYSKAGHHDSAAAIYAQQDGHESAAEAYVLAGNLGLAAECFQKAGNHRRAAQCFDETGIPRDAAEAYARCEMWSDAARCLDAEILDLGAAGGLANTHTEEFCKLCKAAGGFYERAGELEKAQSSLERGEFFVAAAEIAALRSDLDGAVGLSRDRGRPRDSRGHGEIANPPRAPGAP